MDGGKFASGQERRPGGRSVNSGLAPTADVPVLISMSRQQGPPLSGVLVLSASLREAFGEIGLVVSAAVAGLVDTHSPAVAAATLAASAKINSADAIAPVLAALSTNTLSKIVIGWVSGGRSFALRLIPGLILVIAAAWAGAILTS
jgi:uncharacterized membrane protein (DUF4010 family)